ncbi:hypothetical protein SAMN02745885_00644 [Carboxydocella sporoproducens DSM 16521]|uniref:ResB-like family protein n=2 Tax=Carboxydocella TaxID=178898 RepID=A0A1T4MKU0_9FIRM|nr:MULTISPECIES: hypothetical protein [Carboxydocella]AVX21378.1 hypothetical protein CFE_2235 [Carboxydocella thermautotrophica]SJZ67710.1 hypothetical protein SAMN02745885_00644 [Carboxydocella sporoproducens DSM 16521]
MVGGQGGNFGEKGRKIIRAIGSRRAAHWALGLLIAVYLIWLVPFQIYGVPAWRIRNMAASGWVFLPVYWFFMLNLCLCLFFWARQGGKAIYRWLSWLMHAALILLIIAGVLARHSEPKVEFIVTEGQTLDLSRRISYVTPEREMMAEGRLPKIIWRLDFIRPEFWEDKLLFTDLLAKISYGSSQPEKTVSLRLGQPLVQDNLTIGLQGFGYAPRYQVLDKQGRLVSGSFVNLTVFPPGQEDWFALENLNWEVHLLVWPDAELKGNKVNNRSMNLRQPLLYVYVLEKSKKEKDPEGALLAKGFLRPGDELEVQGYRLSFPEIRYYGHFWLVRDKSLPYLKVALLTVVTASLILTYIRWERGKGRWQENS